MSKKYVLTIGIPTYNGSKYLLNTLNSINEQFQDISISDNVEILIMDNHSIDNTSIIVTSFIYSHPLLNIRYCINMKNIRYDRNVDLVIRNAQGKFVWLLADDDIILKNGLFKVMNVILNNVGLSYIFANYENGIEIGVKKDTYFQDGNSFLINSSFKSGLVSSNIFNRNDYLNINGEKYYDSGWIHFGVLLELAIIKPTFIISSEVIKIDGEPRWGEDGKYLNIGLDLIDIFKSMIKLGYKQKTYFKALNVIRGGYIKLIPLAKMRGYKINFKTILRFTQSYWNVIGFWIIDLPLLLLPTFIEKTIYLTLKKIVSFYKNQSRNNEI